MRLIVAFYSFAAGACIGSFLNVVAWRLPRGESVVSPPSHCPRCGAAIRWWQNIPILSWFALRGRCASCRRPISPRYVIVEILTGLLFLAAYWTRRPFAVLPQPYGVFFDWPQVVVLLAVWTWMSLMIVGSLIDFDHKLLPDFVTVGGMVLGVVLNLSISILNWKILPLIKDGPDNSVTIGVVGLINGMSYPIFWSLYGLAFGFGLLWLIRFFGSKAFGREAMGMGDVFLMGAVGAMFGPVAVLVTLILSSVVGSAVGLAGIATSKLRFGGFAEIPYGPYICLGCLAWMFRGPEMVAAYMGMMR